VTILYGAAQGIAAIKSEALSIMEARKPRYHLRAGANYLHFSGLMLTDKRAWAWTGSVEQARKCRRRFDAAAGCKIRAISPVPQHHEEAN
jgi:hypothetical protein